MSRICPLVMTLWTLLLSSAPLAADEQKSSSAKPATLSREQIESARDLMPGVLLREEQSGIPAEETAAYYAVLDRASHADPQQLRDSARQLAATRETELKREFPKLEEFPQFVDLYRHPELYHGKPVSLRGHIRYATRYPANPNDFGITELYELWLVTPDSQTNSATIICTELPGGIPMGEQITDGISVTGYFFKIYAYHDRERKLRGAPLILAKGPLWQPSPQRKPTSGWWYVIAGSVVAAIFLAAWLFRPRRPKLSSLTHPNEQPDLSFLDRSSGIDERPPS